MNQLPWASELDRTNFLAAILNTVGRDVEFQYVSSISGCTASGCYLDPVTNTSTNSFCVVCSGEFWIEDVDSHTELARITWRPSDEVKWVPGGQYFDGDCLIKLPVTTVGIDTIIANTKSVIVDGRDMEIKKVDRRGSPTINRILITLKERKKV